MRVKLEDGSYYTPKPDDDVHCELHNVTVKWKDLDSIQQLAAADGLDIDGPICILKRK